METMLFALGWYAAWSLATFVAFALDKRAAGRGARRTPEKTLHLLSLAGGFPGALLAMRLVRHKRQKAVFVAVVWGVAALHVLAWVAVLWLRW